MQFDLERKTSFGVSADEVISLLQDQGRFMRASGGTEEDSIRFDEKENLWHGISKDSIPLMSKPKYTSSIEKTEKGAKVTVHAAYGVTSIHTWTVEAVSDQECIGTEQATVHTSAFAYYPVKMAFSGAQERSHKSLQEYLS